MVIHDPDHCTMSMDRLNRKKTPPPRSESHAAQVLLPCGQWSKRIGKEAPNHRDAHDLNAQISQDLPGEASGWETLTSGS